MAGYQLNHRKYTLKHQVFWVATSKQHTPCYRVVELQSSWKKNTWKASTKKMHMKTITDALRFGRLCLPFQHGDDEVPVVCFWGWFGWWNNICIFQEQTSSSSSSLRVTISVNDWKGQCYWPFSPLNDNLRSFFGGKSIMCFEIIHETFKQMQEMPGHSVWARHDNSQIWIKLNKSCCGIHEVEWAT